MVTQTRNRSAPGSRGAAAKTPIKTGRPHNRAASEGAVKKETSPPRHQLIAEAAYYIAERRGFGSGNELDDWLQAEREVDLKLKSTMH